MRIRNLNLKMPFPARALKDPAQRPITIGDIFSFGDDAVLVAVIEVFTRDVGPEVAEELFEFRLDPSARCVVVHVAVGGFAGHFHEGFGAGGAEDCLAGWVDGRGDFASSDVRVAFGGWEHAVMMVSKCTFMGCPFFVRDIRDLHSGWKVFIWVVLASGEFFYVHGITDLEFGAYCE